MEREEEITIDLGLIFKILLKYIRIIIVSTLVMGILFFSVSSFVKTPKYQSDIQLYVNNISDNPNNFNGVTTGELSAAQSLVKTYLVILETRTTLESVIEEGNLDYTYQQLAGMIEATSVNSTEIFKVTVTSTDAKEAAHIANTIAKVLPNAISDIVDGSKVRIVAYGEVAENPSSPNTIKDTIIGLALGMFLSVGSIVLYTLFDNTIRTPDYVTSTFSYPILASIPDKNKGRKE